MTSWPLQVSHVPLLAKHLWATGMPSFTAPSTTRGSPCNSSFSPQRLESIRNLILYSLWPDTIYVKATLDTKEILVISVIMCPDSQETKVRRTLRNGYQTLSFHKSLRNQKYSADWFCPGPNSVKCRPRSHSAFLSFSLVSSFLTSQMAIEDKQRKEK